MTSDGATTQPGGRKRRERSEVPLAPETFALAVLSVDRFVAELSGSAVFREAGLGARDWAVLSIVGQYPLAEAKLVRQLRLTQAAGDEFLGGLKAQGLVAVDGASGALALTDAGRARLSVVDAAVRARLDTVGRRRGAIRKLPKILRTLVQTFD